MKKTTLEILILVLILALSLFLRWYRTNDLLGFHYDQGRDALVIRNLLKNDKFFLVGPVTGLEGIFLGPLLYYALAPFYWLSGGNPDLPAMFMSGIHVATILFLWKLGRQVSVAAGLLAALVFGLSQPLFWLSRWLSNPPPLMFFSVLLAFSLYQITKGKEKYWMLAALSIGAGLQFEVASAAFYLITISIFWLWRKSERPKRKILLASLAIFIASLLPQVMFDVRHQFVMTKNVLKEVLTRQTLDTSHIELAKTRLLFYQEGFANKLFTYDQTLIKFGFPLLLLIGLLTVKTWISPLTKLLILLILPQLVVLLVFRGNHGNVYDYHLIGSFPLFVLLLSIWLAKLSKSLPGKLLLMVFILIFLYKNLPLGFNVLRSGTDGPTHVSLGNQLQAVRWVYEDTPEGFNTDVYVPPVIPHAYDYLFAWVGDKYLLHPQSALTNRLYTLYEQDPPFPDRLNQWLDRQVKIGKIEDSVKFGGITVDRRTRLTDGN